MIFTFGEGLIFGALMILVFAITRAADRIVKAINKKEINDTFK